MQELRLKVIEKNSNNNPEIEIFNASGVQYRQEFNAKHKATENMQAETYKDNLMNARQTAIFWHALTKPERAEYLKMLLKND